MICILCNFKGDSKEFSQTNRSADGSRAICKKCRRESAKKGYERKMAKAAELPYFDLNPNLIGIRSKARIGILIMNNFVDRESRKKKGFHNINIGNVGLTAILNELKEPYEHCPPEAMNQFEFILVSLTSVMDVENLIYNLEVYAPQERKCKVIIGGFGVINIKLIISYIDIAVFGRAEGQINEILAGQRYQNVWRKMDDPTITGQYIIRQPQYLVEGERSVGCRNKCAYCQYTYVRQAIGKAGKYDPGMITQETDWNGLDIIKAGRYNSAWDGWSDETRRKVHKPVTDKMIEEKLAEIDALNIKGTVSIKIFMIVGYPWETMDTVLKDIDQTKIILNRIDGQMKGKVNLSFLCTPYNPAPMTPMECERADIETNWRALNGYLILDGKHIRAYISPFTSGGYLLMKRVMINRAEIEGIELFKRVAFSKELLKLSGELRVKWLLKYNVINQAIFKKIDSKPVPYLSVEEGIPRKSMMLW